MHPKGPYMNCTENGWSVCGVLLDVCASCTLDSEHTLTYWHTDILTYWPTDLLTCWHTDILTYWPTDLLTCWHTDMLTYWPTDMLTYWRTDILTYWHTDILTYWHSDILKYSHSVVPSIHTSQRTYSWTLHTLERVPHTLTKALHSTAHSKGPTCTHTRKCSARTYIQMPCCHAGQIDAAFNTVCVKVGGGTHTHIHIYTSVCKRWGGKGGGRDVCACVYLKATESVPPRRMELFKGVSAPL